MIDLLTLFISIISAIIVALITPYFTHKLSIRYLKKEFAFKRKIHLFEKIGEFTWKNHLALTTLENLSSKNNSNQLEIVKQQLKSNLMIITSIFDRAMYLPREITYNLGKYTSSIENYINNPQFGENKSVKELRKKSSPYIKIINKLIEEEIKNIK